MNTLLLKEDSGQCLVRVLGVDRYVKAVKAEDVSIWCMFSISKMHYF